MRLELWLRYPAGGGGGGGGGGGQTNTEKNIFILFLLIHKYSQFKYQGIVYLTFTGH